MAACESARMQPFLFVFTWLCARPSWLRLEGYFSARFGLGGGLLVKTKTRRQVETAKMRAENFVRNVQGDDERAAEIADETVEEYADRKGIEMVENPNRRRITMPKNRPAVRLLEAEIEKKDAYIEELEGKLASVKETLFDAVEIVQDDDEVEDETAEQSDEEENDEKESGDESDDEEEEEEEEKPTRKARR